MSYTKAIQKMIDDGDDVLQIAKLFGGINRLIQLSKASPYLTALIQTKLGGYLQCSAEDEDEVMVAFNLDFVITELELNDLEDVQHYNASVNIIIPELTEGSEMQMLYSWLEEYLMDLGSEVANYNDKELSEKMIWVYADSINGKKFKRNNDEVSDIEILKILPSWMKD
jgi:hypothetical protein